MNVKEIDPTEQNIKNPDGEVVFDSPTWIAKYGKVQRIPGTLDGDVLIIRKPDQTHLSNNGGDYYHAVRETEDGDIEYNLMFRSEFSEWKGGYGGEIREA